MWDEPEMPLPEGQSVEEFLVLRYLLGCGTLALAAIVIVVIGAIIFR
jgi:hypothetical protein